MANDGDNTLIAGPYKAPNGVRVGQRLTDLVRGEVVVAGLTRAPIPWPYSADGGRPALILCGDLARAVRVESSRAVRHHWGVSSATVGRWRKALGIGPYTEGDRRLHSRHWATTLGVEDCRAGGAGKKGQAIPARVAGPGDGPLAQLAAARVAAGLTQAAVAERLGLTQSQVSRLERGERRAGDPGMLRRYCRAIGCDSRTIDPGLASARSRAT